MLASRRWNILRVFVRVSSQMMRLLPRPNRITLERRRKAILIGINYDDAPEQHAGRLTLPQTDMEKVRALLKENFGFRDEEIIMLTDNVTEVEAGTSQLPTRENIMRAINEFIIPGQDHTDYWLFYSGHSDQHVEPDNVKRVEVDGLQEFIVPLDAKQDGNKAYFPDSVIYDKYLHETIILPLEQTRGCHLFAVMDACHSATLLNLGHDRCNRVGTATSAVRRAIRHYVVEDVLVPIRNSFLRRRKSAAQSLESEAPSSTPDPSAFTVCTGFCPRVPNTEQKSTVICISACKDNEIVLENERCGSLTSAIVEVLEVKPKATLKDVIYTARYTVHDVRRAAKGAFLRRWTSFTQFKEAKKLAALARWNPQLSSNDPLDTNTTLLYFDLHTQCLDRHGRVRRPALESIKRLNPIRYLTLPTRSTFHRIGDAP